MWLHELQTGLETTIFFVEVIDLDFGWKCYFVKIFFRLFNLSGKHAVYILTTWITAGLQFVRYLAASQGRTLRLCLHGCKRRLIYLNGAFAHVVGVIVCTFWERIVKLALASKRTVFRLTRSWSALTIIVGRRTLRLRVRPICWVDFCLRIWFFYF